MTEAVSRQQQCDAAEADKTGQERRKEQNLMWLSQKKRKRKKKRMMRAKQKQVSKRMTAIDEESQRVAWGQCGKWSDRETQRNGMKLSLQRKGKNYSMLQKKPQRGVACR